MSQCRMGEGAGLGKGSHGMLLDAWDELLGIRIQPAVDLGEKKKKQKTPVSLNKKGNRKWLCH